MGHDVPPEERKVLSLSLSIISGSPWQEGPSARRQVRTLRGGISRVGKVYWGFWDPCSYRRTPVLERADLFFLEYLEEPALHVSCGCLIYL